MTGFSNAESPEEFKHRLNSLTEILNKTGKNLNQTPNKTEIVVIAINSSTSSDKGEKTRLS